MTNTDKSKKTQPLAFDSITSVKVFKSLALLIHNKTVRFACFAKYTTSQNRMRIKLKC
jgi:hypothetical protein